jgi:Skp family chaperone for outer membrane proteins
VLNVKQSHLAAVLVAGVLATCVLSLLLTGSAGAQGVAPARTVARPGGSVALLDVGYIFEKHLRFKMMTDDLKGDIEGAEADVQAERKTLTGMVEQLREFRNVSPTEYKRMEEDVANRQAALQVRIQLQRKEFVQREARIYHTVYQEILQELEYYCEHNPIDMVLNFSGNPVDVERPESVLAYINRPVVRYGKDRDITGYILNALNERVRGTQTPAPGGMGSRPITPPFQPR